MITLHYYITSNFNMPMIASHNVRVPSRVLVIQGLRLELSRESTALVISERPILDQYLENNHI